MADAAPDPGPSSENGDEVVHLGALERGSSRAAPGRSGSTFERGLSVLAALARCGEARAHELAGEVGMPVSTAYRYLRALKQQGFVVEAQGLYRMGPVLRQISHPSNEYERLVSIAAPIMERLTLSTQETATLVVQAGLTSGVCVHQTPSPRPDPTMFRIGQMLPLHAGAGERLLLAFAPREVIQTALLGELERFTENTPGPLELRRKLLASRKSWITISRSELVAGAIAIATPVRSDGRVVCSLTVSGPETRCGSAWQARAKPVLYNAGRALEHLLREL